MFLSLGAQKSVSLQISTVGICIFFGGLLGAVWMLPGLWGPGLSVLLLPTLTFTKQWQSRYLIAFTYYLTGSIGICPGSANFFGPGHWGLGILLWLSSALLLAIPWIMARGSLGMLTALVIATVPPFGLIGWLSPLNSVGILFPGLGIIGLVFFLGMALVIGAKHWNWILLFGIMAICSNLLYTKPVMPTNWQGCDTAVHPTKSFLSEVSQIATWTTTARTLQTHYLLFPEDVAGEWLSGTQDQIEEAVPTGHTWFVGASKSLGEEHYWSDAVFAVTHHHAQLLFQAPFTVPISMWHPWKQADQYPILWWESTKTFNGQRVWASICYSQLLPWIWIEGVIQHPDLILAPRNDWWATGTDIPAIQHASTLAWSRLVGAPIIEATNR